MYRHARLILMFVIAASLGLFLAYRERNNRDKAMADTPVEPAATGAAEAAHAVGAAPGAPTSAVGRAIEEKIAVGAPRADDRAVAPHRPQPKKDQWVAPKTEPRPTPPPEGPTRAY